MTDLKTQAIDNAKVIDFRVRVPAQLCPKIETPQENKTQYDAVLAIGDKYQQAQTVDDLLQQMDANGVDHAIVHAEHEHGDVADD